MLITFCALLLVTDVLLNANWFYWFVSLSQRRYLSYVTSRSPNHVQQLLVKIILRDFSGSKVGCRYYPWSCWVLGMQPVILQCWCELRMEQRSVNSDLFVPVPVANFIAYCCHWLHISPITMKISIPMMCKTSAICPNSRQWPHVWPT